MRILVTGGAGFVGSSLALALRGHHPDWDVIALDNLKRRGSELTLPRLAAGGVRFLHGDVRVPSDLAATGACDLILECSAEPSVLAGLGGSTAYVLDTNLVGTIHCLELARRLGAGFLFLSTSRVYPIEALTRLPIEEHERRFELAPRQVAQGVSEHGISEALPLDGYRSLYGATKLCSELLVTEYVAAFGIPAVVNRCGVLAGPWQMGRVDQGVVMHWAASHLFGWPLQYIGFGGEGKQVRDVLHVADLAALVERQIPLLHALAGRTFNVGGGRDVSTSLLELTDLCVEATGRRVPITSVAETRVADVPLYLSDTRRVRAETGWAPVRSMTDIVRDSVEWLRRHQDDLVKVFDPTGERRSSARPS